MTSLPSNKHTTAICIESSHKKGMGHFYRALNLVEYLNTLNESNVLIINDDPITARYLEERGLPFVIKNYADVSSNWETEVIRDYKIHIWINDRLNTDQRHAENIKGNGVKLISFDDKGDGAILADINFAPLLIDEECALQGKKVLRGIDYLILNKEIDGYKRLRRGGTNILVTLGGSDTYDVTLVILRALKQLNISATLHLGPLFGADQQLEKEIDGNYPVIRGVPSLIKEMYKYDLAITGGGITPFEANASGLPCLMVSSEDHESPGCSYLDSAGTSRYLGFRDNIDAIKIKETLAKIDIERMSLLGMQKIRTSGVDNVWGAIKELGDE